MKSYVVKYGLAVMATLMLGACAGPGARVEIPFTLPTGKTGTLVAHNRQVPSWLIADNGYALNYMYTGELSKDKLAAVAEAERACRLYTGTVHPSNLVAVVSGGFLYGVIGFPIGGLASKAFTGAQFNEYAKYFSIASAGGGLSNGIITLGGKSYTFQDCGEVVLSSDSAYKDIKILRDNPY